jgi:hypothetical protein
LARRLAPAFVAASLAACGSSTPGTTGPQMSDSNNYVAMSTMKIPVVQTKAGADLTISWDGIMKDLLCHPAQPIKALTFAIFPNKTVDQLNAELSVGNFNPNEVLKYFVLDNPTTTTTMLSSIGASTKVAPATDYVESTSKVYLIIFANTVSLGVGAESMVIVQPSSSSTNTTVAAPDACSSTPPILTFSATLGAPLSVPKAGPYTIGWGNLTKNGFQQSPFPFATIDKIEIGYYQGMQASDLQAHFTDVEINATTLYSSKSVGGAKSFDLTGAKTSDGTAFSGFTQTDGAWAMALLCSNCSVPAPLAFTVLQPE